MGQKEEAINNHLSEHYLSNMNRDQALALIIKAITSANEEQPL